MMWTYATIHPQSLSQQIKWIWYEIIPVNFMKHYLQNLKQSQAVFGDFLYSVLQAATGKKKTHGL